VNHPELIKKFISATIIFEQLLTTDTVLVSDNERSHTMTNYCLTVKVTTISKNLTCSQIFTALRTIIHRIYNASDNRMFQHAVKKLLKSNKLKSSFAAFFQAMTLPVFKNSSYPKVSS
jgi:hypothetical protein